jgi:periplasmic protein TonB
MSTVAENTGNSLTRRLVRSNASSTIPRIERNAIALMSTAMISALFVMAAVAQPTPPEPKQTPTEAPAPPSPEQVPAVASWQQAVIARLARFQRYPTQAKGATGVVSLSFSIDRQGHVLNSKIIKSSGSAVLDAEALSLLTRAAPLPPPPAAVPDSDLTFVLPIRFATRVRPL